MTQKERWYHGPYGGNPWFQFSSHLDRFDRNWRNDPFWRDLYPRWAEPIFKEGIDVKTDIVNDRSRFSVGIDAYQFRPEELQVSMNKMKFKCPVRLSFEISVLRVSLKIIKSRHEMCQLLTSRFR